MNKSPTPSHDVLIAGAGPVGLLLACELRLAGCTVLILEQARDPHSPLKGPPFGLRGLSVPTIESLDRRGLLEAIKDRATDRETAAAAHCRPSRVERAAMALLRQDRTGWQIVGLVFNLINVTFRSAPRVRRRKKARAVKHAP